MISANVCSEIGPLRSVIIRRPGKELKLLTPDRMQQWLFDDIVDVEIFQKEHDIFTGCLRAMGVNVIDFNDLLLNVLESSAHAKTILKKSFGGILKSADIESLIQSNSPADICKYLITGFPPFSSLSSFIPLLNTMFTRDIGAMVGNRFLPATASKRPRKREINLAQQILRLHSDFNHIQHLIYPRNYSLEGGDIHVLSQKVVCIGISERSSKRAIEKVIPLLHKQGFIYVITVDLERKRSCMHLDTVFTMINHGECLVFEPMILKQGNSTFCTATIYPKQGKLIKVKEGLLKAFSEVGITLKPILCGGSNEINQEREQWTDGVNALAVAPGHIFNYRRNKHTIAELVRFGYQKIHAEDVDKPLPRDQKFVIVFPGFELSRGRGGAHCLTFPLNRA